MATGYHLQCPKFDWKAQDQIRAYDQFQAKAKLWLAGEKTEPELQYTKIVLMLGDEGLSRWTKFKLSEDDQKDPEKVFKAFRDSLGSEESFHTARAKLYTFRQQKGETVNELDIRLSRLIDECKFPEPEAISQFLKRDILINSISYYEVKKWVNQQKETDATFTYTKVIDECRKYEAAVRDYISMKHDNPDLKTAYQEGTQKCDNNHFRRRRFKSRSRSRSRSRSGSRDRFRKKQLHKPRKTDSKCK